jgi:hypothetical protein
MGASLSWFAVRGKTPESILQEFGLKNVGKKYRDTPFCGGPLPNNWFLLILGHHEFTDTEAQRLSTGCEVVGCFVEEHVMVSRAAGWKDGKEIWSVTHNAEEDLLHLDVRGEMPDGFSAISDRLFKQQEDADGVDFIFDIPVTTAEQISGYRHDRRSDLILENFVKPTFFEKLFGARG